MKKSTLVRVVFRENITDRKLLRRWQRDYSTVNYLSKRAREATCLSIFNLPSIENMNVHKSTKSAFTRLRNKTRSITKNKLVWSFQKRIKTIVSKENIKFRIFRFTYALIGGFKRVLWLRIPPVLTISTVRSIHVKISPPPALLMGIESKYIFGFSVY